MTSIAFQFVLDTELRRAVRSRNSVTLVLMETSHDFDPVTDPRIDDGAVHEVGAVIAREIRDTDLIGHTADGTLSLVLLDADFDSTSRVIDRVRARLEAHSFAHPVRIVVGAACYPTHAVDAATLNQQAKARPIASWQSR
jgi:GGDEF domain-containing protein